MEYSLKGKAFDYIKQNIINCVYMPNTILSEAELISEMDISRTPIREALCKLEQEGLIQILPKRGIIVKDISISEVSMIFEERLRTEPYIIKNYIQNIDRASLEAIYLQLTPELLDDKHFIKLYSIDHLLHSIINEACPNPYITKHMEHVLNQSNRLRIIAGSNIHQRQTPTTTEHLQLIDSLLHKSTANSVELMEEHLINSRDAAIRSLINADISAKFLNSY
ncbi:MAG: GntR family transcriptional regulator [Eubacteriales bacterium]